MGDDTLPVTILKSKAGEKLADAIKNVVDYAAGPDRVRNIAKARADAAIIQVKADVEVEAIRAQAAERLLDQEIRSQRNINAITDEAFKALPPPGKPVSDEPVSEDFIFRFFEDCKGIGDPEMQQIWGALLAGEVVRPGSFHPRTLRIVKDMLPADAALFSALCRFVFPFGVPTTLVFNEGDPIYKNNGLTYMKLQHLETMGLIAFNHITGFRRQSLPAKFTIPFEKQVMEVALQEGSDTLKTGRATFTEAGQQLETIVHVERVPGFIEYVAERWRDEGHKVTVSN